jgi:hypothetical protein
MKRSKLNTLLDELTGTVQQFLSLTEEKQTILARERAARQQLETATTGPRFDDDETAAKVSTAATMIATIEGRRVHIQKNLKPLLEKLREHLRLAEEHWTAIVRLNGDQLAQRFYKAISSFYEGGKTPDIQTVPAWNELNRSALWHGCYVEMNESNAISMVNDFILTVQRNLTTIDLTLADKE